MMSTLCFVNLHLNAAEILLPQYLDAYVHPNNYGAAVQITPSILHILYTGESLEDSLKTFGNPEENVSVHYLIAEDGSIYRLVPESRCAWHAGKSSWGGLTSINKHSIGVALVNKGITDQDAQIHGWDSNFPEYTRNQIQSLIHLSSNIIERHHIKPWNIVGHSDIAPDRKFDPGLKFPWKTLAEKGIGLFPKGEIQQNSQSVNTKDFFHKLSNFGYNVPDLNLIEDFLSPTYRKIVAAFQAHYRPTKVDGIIDAELEEILNQLLAEKNK
jgi:N-acetylmuramoyl-L-alanine amidase